jgi:putative Mn2+ efflux pump MntP
MSILEILLLGVGLAMDAFAVSVCKGLAMRKVNIKQTAVIALFFGGFQALMPLLGYFLGSTFAAHVKQVDHWIAFILLAYIGGKMIADAIREMKEVPEVDELDPPLNIPELFIMAIATSIDALAVGVTFSFMEVNIFLAVSVIGIVTFVLSAIAVFIGIIFGVRFRTIAQVAGGAILVLLGTRILLTHLGII